jgi:hypothetical protein
VATELTTRFATSADVSSSSRVDPSAAVDAMPHMLTTFGRRSGIGLDGVRGHSPR